MDVPAHDLTRTIDCQVVGCDQAAEPGALVCHRHERVQKRCRVVGCEVAPSGKYSRGVLANLCPEHEDDARQEASERASRGGRAGRGVPHTVPAEGTFTQKAKALVPLAKKLDAAIVQQEREKDKLRHQRSALDQRERVIDQDVIAALAEWRRALQALAS